MGLITLSLKQAILQALPLVIPERIKPKNLKKKKHCPRATLPTTNHKLVWALLPSSGGWLSMQVLHNIYVFIFNNTGSCRN
jgi:hypothetical protein